MVLAGAYAELAGGAMVIESLDTAGTERNQSLSTLGIFLGGDISKSSVHMILCVGGCTCCNHGTGHKECASALVNLIGLLFTGGALAWGNVSETYGIILTCLNAVKTIHASAVINLVVFGINAAGLASAAAFAAVNAFVLINDGAQQ